LEGNLSFSRKWDQDRGLARDEKKGTERERSNTSTSYIRGMNVTTSKWKGKERGSGPTKKGSSVGVKRIGGKKGKERGGKSGAQKKKMYFETSVKGGG